MTYKRLTWQSFETSGNFTLHEPESLSSLTAESSSLSWPHTEYIYVILFLYFQFQPNVRTEFQVKFLNILNAREQFGVEWRKFDLIIEIVWDEHIDWLKHKLAHKIGRQFMETSMVMLVLFGRVYSAAKMC